MPKALFFSPTPTAAALAKLARAHPQLQSTAWKVYATDDATALAPIKGTLPANVEGNVRMAPKTPSQRQANSLWGVLSPTLRVKLVAEEEILFCVPAESESLLRLEEAFLDLGRTDMRWYTRGEHVWVRCLAPSVHLRLRVQEGVLEGVTAWTRHEQSSLWVEDGYAHPLADVWAKTLSSRDWVWVSRTGDAATAPALEGGVTWNDRMEKLFSLPAKIRELIPVTEPSQFSISVRMVEDTEATPDADAWFLSEDQWEALSAAWEEIPQDELSRFSAALLQTDTEKTYLLEEKHVVGSARMGVHIVQHTGARSWARVRGADNLYVPVGWRVAPRLRREALRALFRLDSNAKVFVTGTLSAPRVEMLVRDTSEPLASFLEYAPPARATCLERLEEELLFTWPDLQRELPPPEKKSQSEAPRIAPPPIPKKRAQAKTAPERKITPPPPEERSPAVDDATRVRVAELERQLSAGGVREVAPWAELAELKARLGEAEDASTCWETVLFFAPSDEAASALEAQRLQLVAGKGGAPDPTDLLMADPPLFAGSTYLGARALREVTAGKVFVDSSTHFAADKFFRQEKPVSKKLAWSVLRGLHAYSRDRIGLTTAKTALVGAVSERGLSELYDVPRFVRKTLATAGNGILAADQARALDALWARAAVYPLEENSLGGYIRTLFAVGFARCGIGARAADLFAAVEKETPIHDTPNQILFQLYRARAASFTLGTSAEMWKNEVSGAIAKIREARVRDRVEWLRKRSEWLRTETTPEINLTVKPTLETVLAEVEASPELAPARLEKIFQIKDIFDYEVVVATQRTLQCVLRCGDEDLLRKTLNVIPKNLSRITIDGYRASVLGTGIRAAATLNESALVDAWLDEVVRLSSAARDLTPKDLLQAVEPGLKALYRFGALESARKLFSALDVKATRTSREGIKLRCALAQGYLQVGEKDRATRYLRECAEDSLGSGLDNVGRHDAATTALRASRHWPREIRVEIAQKILASLDLFKDTYTASQQGIYETHKVLLVETCVDAMVDDVTFQSDRLRDWMDAEERVWRQQVLGDWRAALGTA
jgi:hypothetical protein